jgi:hypothetical protein
MTTRQTVITAVLVLVTLAALAYARRVGLPPSRPRRFRRNRPT